MNTLLQTIHILGALFLILVVLLQSGRGGGMGATFGGAAGQIFGGRGASNFLTRVTTGAAIFFFATSLMLSMLSSQHRSVVQQAETHKSAPAAPAPSATNSAADVADVKEAAKAHDAVDVKAAAPTPTANTTDAPSSEAKP